MFDDLQKPNQTDTSNIAGSGQPSQVGSSSGITGAPPANLPGSEPSHQPLNKQPEDMFANIDTGRVPASPDPVGPPPPPSFRPIAPTEPSSLSPHDFAEISGKNRKGPIIAIIVIVIIVIAAGAWAGWFFFLREKPAVNEIITKEESAKNEAVTAEPLENINEEPIAEPEAPVLVPKDTDQDGLSDNEEDFYGTNPSLVDTDKDNLSDRDEVKVYGTDPINPDTDGDSYADGHEIRNGYNPKGSGKLLNLP